MKNLLFSFKREYKNTSNNMKFYILNGILFTAMATLSRNYAIKFLDRLGAGNFEYSLYNALPGFIAIFSTIPGIVLISSSSNKKKIISNFFYLSRAFILTFIIISFLNTNYKSLFFVILFSLMNLPESIATTSLQSYSGDIFVPKDRSTAVSLKNKYSTLFGILFMFITAFILKIPKTNNGAIITYDILYVIAFIIGIFEVKTLKKLKEVNSTEPTRISFFDSLISIYNNKNFLIFLVCSLAFHFSWQMCWPLINLYQIKVLKADELWLTIINVMSSLVMFFAYGFWDKIIKSRGNAFCYGISAVGMALTPILIAISPNLYIYTLTGTASGFFTAGIMTVVLTSLLEASPVKERMLCIAIHTTLTNITLTIAPFVSQFILEKTNIYIALYIVAVFRLFGALTLIIRNKMLEKAGTIKHIN